jgi:organic radical activating enzyme
MIIQLGLIITQRCTIACRHCLFSAESGNSDAQDMSLADIYQYIDQTAKIARRTNDHFAVGFTGGEPFLRSQDLLASIAHAKKMAAQQITTVTNGFWGSDQARAAQMVAALKEAGLSNLALSIDDFHQASIPLDALLKIITACKASDLAFTIKTTVTKKSRRLPDILHDLGDLLLDQKVTIEEIACVPAGRARLMIPRAELLYQDGMPIEACPMGMMLVILPNGDTFPCCGTGWNPRLFLGNTRETALTCLYARMKDQPLLMLLREKGPHCLVSYLEAGGYPLEQQQYICNCELCQQVLTHPGLEHILPTVLDDWRGDRVQQLFNFCLND